MFSFLDNPMLFLNRNKLKFMLAFKGAYFHSICINAKAISSKKLPDKGCKTCKLESNVHSKHFLRHFLSVYTLQIR